MDHGQASNTPFPSKQIHVETIAVLPRVGRKLGPHHLRKGGQQISLANGFVPSGTGLHLGRPTNKKGHTVTTLVDGSFPLAIDSVGLVLVELGSLGPGFLGTVVAGKNNQGVIC